MKKMIVAALLAVAAFGLRTTHMGLPGGWNDVAVDNDIDQFIRQRITTLKDATLASTRAQVVAGTNYEYTYKKGDATWKVFAFDQPWTETRSISKVEQTTESVNGNTKTTKVVGSQVQNLDFTEITRNVINK